MENKFEYTIINVKINSDYDISEKGIDRTPQIPMLNKMDSEGWELIAVTSDVIQNRIVEQLSKPPKTVTTFLDTYYFKKLKENN